MNTEIRLDMRGLEKLPERQLFFDYSLIKPKMF